MTTEQKAARTFGIFLILAFLSYGIGTGVINSIVTAEDFLSNVYVNKPLIVVGVFLMAIVHTFIIIGLPIILLPILKPYNKYFAYGFLSAAIATGVILVVGTLFLLLLLPLSEEYVKAGSVVTSELVTLGVVLKHGNFFAYHMGMALWSIAGLMMVTLFYISKLIPRWMSLWGMLGYTLLLMGSILELAGHNDMLEVASVAVGGLFEVTLSILLIVKGFSSFAVDSKSIIKEKL